MKWAAMYLIGFIVLVGGLLAALWKLGILQNIGTTWTLIGVAILIGIGIMISVSHSGSKENIQVDIESRRQFIRIQPCPSPCHSMPRVSPQSPTATRARRCST